MLLPPLTTIKEMENRDFRREWLSHCCWQRSKGTSKDRRSEGLFAWNGAKAGNSKDAELGSKEAKRFEPSILYKEEIHMDEVKMMHPQLISWGFQFQSLIMKMNSKNPKSWCTELPKQKIKKNDLNRCPCHVSPSIKRETGEKNNTGLPLSSPGFLSYVKRVLRNVIGAQKQTKTINWQMLHTSKWPHGSFVHDIIIPGHGSLIRELHSEKKGDSSLENREDTDKTHQQGIKGLHLDSSEPTRDSS